MTETAEISPCIRLPGFPSLATILTSVVFLNVRLLIGSCRVIYAQTSHLSFLTYPFLLSYTFSLFKKNPTIMVLLPTDGIEGGVLL